MITQLLSDNDILDYLMTSDFDDGLTKEEAKFLLLKYRSFYRIMSAKNDNFRNKIDELKTTLSETNELNLIKINSLNIDIDYLKRQLETEKTRKLTLRERIFGIKIKTENGY